MKKLLALCALTGCAFAYQSAQASLEERVSQLELQTSMNTCGAAVPALQKDTPNNVQVSFDVIYWQPRVDLTDFGASWNPNDAILGRYGNMSTKANKFGMQFGFKAGLGYRFAAHGWNLDAQYTYNNFTDTASANSDNLAITPGPFSPIVDVTLAYKGVKSNYSIGYQTVDLALSKGFFVNQYTSLTPFYGVKAAWINHLPHTIAQVVKLTNVTVVLGDEHTNISEKTRSLGPMGGFGFNWFFCDGWSLYTNTGAALLFTSYRGSVQTVGFYDIDASAFTERVYRISANKQYICPNLFLALGLSYTHYFEESENYLNLHIGYETQQYITQSYVLGNPSTLSAADKPSPRNLGLMGLTAGAVLKF